MSLPTSTLSIDLNGTGTLVDVSLYVDESQSVTHSWGRTDWTAASPNPGVLTFTLRNLDGRFTPGNTAVYTVGMRQGLTVKWQVGTRYRWFVTGVPQVSWDNGNANSSTVTVTCSDVLGACAQHTMGTFLDEELFANVSSAALWYWRLDESGSDLTVRPQDSSGNGGPNLVPTGIAADYSWAQNSGPRKDPGGGLGLNMTAVTQPVQGVDYLYTSPVQARRFGSTLGTFSQFTAIAWVAPRAFASMLPQILMAFDVATMHIAVTWQATATGTVLAVRTSTGLTNTFVNAVPAANVTSSLEVGIKFDGANFSAIVIVNDDLTETASTATAAIPNHLQTVYIGGDLTSAFSAGSYGGYSGSICRVAVVTGAYAGILASLYRVGASGAPERPSARLSRFAGYAGTTVTAHGTDRGDTVAVQNTSGQTLLDAICDALRTEDAAIITDGDSSSTWLAPYLYTVQRPTSSSFTVDADADASGAPVFSFDTSGVASTVAVTSPTTSATWRYNGTANWFPARTAALTSGLWSPISALNVAQYRANQGRVSVVQPSTVTVDVAHAVNSLTTSLLTAWPGQRITIGNCPSAICGYSTIDAYVIGATESYTNESAAITLNLQPIDQTGTPFVVENATTGLLDATADNYLPSSITNVATSIAVANDTVTHFSTTTPYTILIDSEQMTVTAVSQAAGTDTLTVTRHANGTTAATHAAGAFVTIAGTGVLVY